MRERLIISLSQLNVGSSLQSMEQVAKAMSTATSNPNMISMKSFESSLEFSEKLAKSLSGSNAASLSQTEAISQSLLSCLGGSMVALSSLTAPASDPSQTELTPEKDIVMEKSLGEAEIAKLRNSTASLEATISLLANLLMNKKVPGMNISALHLQSISLSITSFHALLA